MNAPRRNSRPVLRAARAATRPVRNLRLIWKLLIPSLALILFVGTTGAYWTVRFLTSKAQVSLDSELVRRSLDAEVFLRDDSLYLLETLRFAANIDGVADAVDARDPSRTASLLASVTAVRTRIDMLAATDATGAGLFETTRSPSGVGATHQAPWSEPFISDVLSGRSAGEKRAGFVTIGGRTFLTIAGPVRAAIGPAAGIVIAGMDVTGIAREAATRVGSPFALYADGRLLARSNGRFPQRAPISPDDRPVRRKDHAGGHMTETAYAQIELQGGLPATAAVTMPAAPAFASVRGAGTRLAVVLTAAMLAGALLAAALSRLMLGQVKMLLETNRRLGRGDLSARAPILGNDELGELAGGLNVMAEQLEASYNELEMRVAARTEELRRMHESRSEFFAAIGHEFRTPLFAIKGHADLMLDPDFRPGDDQWVGEFGTTIRESADQLLERVDEILELARSASGRLELDLHDVDVVALVAGVRRQFEALARRNDLTFEVELADGLSLVRADPVRLRQVVLNLVSNAVKYTPPDGHVGLHVRADRGHVVIDVIDTGIGVPAQVGDRIFEPFYQVKGSRPQHGESSSGLGLALTKRLVEAHGGTISFSSTPGVGTAFSVRFPAASGRRPRPRRAGARVVTT